MADEWNALPGPDEGLPEGMAEEQAPAVAGEEGEQEAQAPPAADATPLSMIQFVKGFLAQQKTARTPKTNRKRKRPPSITQVKRQAAKEKADLNRREKFTLPMCTATEWRGHQASDPHYDPALVVRLRLYFFGLPRLDQRQFLAPGFRCCLDSEKGESGGNMAYKKLHTNYRLEVPDILGEKLTAAQLTGIFPSPALSDMQPVRQKYLHWLVGVSVSFTNQPGKVLSAMGPKNYHERRYKIAPVRRVVVDKRPGQMQTLMAHWFADQRTQHTVVRVCVCVCVCVCV